VQFDASKEGFYIIDRRSPVGGKFRLLGVTFDPTLVMDTACFEIAAQAHARLKTLLRGVRFFNVRVLVWLYKSHVLSFVEYSTPAIHHAPAFFLAQIDRVQETFLEEVGLSAEVALFDHGLAPLSSRRDIAMLGLLQRIVCGASPPHFSDVIRRESTPVFPRCLRSPSLRHSCQLQDPIDGTHSRMMERSVLGIIYTYNLLPQHVVGSIKVSTFQRKLQMAVKQAAKLGVCNWASLFRSGIKRLSVESFQKLFS